MVDSDNDICASTQFLQNQKNQLIEQSAAAVGTILQCSTCVSFLQAKYDLNLIKSFFLPILVNERDIELIVIKNQTISCRSNLLIISCLIFSTFLAERQDLTHLLRHTKLQKEKDSSLRKVWSPWQIAEYRFSPYGVSYNKLPNCNSFGAECVDYDNLLKRWLITG